MRGAGPVVGPGGLAGSELGDAASVMRSYPRNTLFDSSRPSGCGARRAGTIMPRPQTEWHELSRAAPQAGTETFDFSVNTMSWSRSVRLMS